MISIPYSPADGTNQSINQLGLQHLILQTKSSTDRSISLFDILVSNLTKNNRKVLESLHNHRINQSRSMLIPITAGQSNDSIGSTTSLAVIYSMGRSWSAFEPLGWKVLERSIDRSIVTCMLLLTVDRRHSILIDRVIECTLTSWILYHITNSSVSTHTSLISCWKVSVSKMWISDRWMNLDSS